MGRMVRIVSPFPAVENADLGFTRSERLYYDGVRRIQEVVTDPVLNLGKSVEEGNSGAIDAKDENPKLDDKGNPIESEKDQTFEVYLEREYVWGPGDAPGGGGTARVVGEWAYDAYGEPIVASHPHAHAVLKCGHKGLFFDRLDAGVVGLCGGEEVRRVEPGAQQSFRGPSALTPHPPISDTSAPNCNGVVTPANGIKRLQTERDLGVGHPQGALSRASGCCGNPRIFGRNGENRPWRGAMWAWGV